jgi:hypothetical protein
MAYTLVNGRLEYRDKRGSGPCRRRLVGTPNRRHIKLEGLPEGATYHVTKGRILLPRDRKDT